MRNQAAIVGIGWTDYTRRSGTSVEHLANLAARRAVEDAGLSAADVDGVVSYGLGDTVASNVVATGLGLPRLRHYADFSGGGNLACAVITHAAMVVACGLAETILVYRALNGASGIRYNGPEFGRALTASGLHSDAEAQFLEPQGILAPAHQFALLCRRHMIKYGTTADHLCAVAVTCRNHALDNPRAMMRTTLSAEEYFESPWIVEPFRLYDCCLQTDGACALIVTTPERARDLRRPPILFKGGVTGTGPRNRGAMWANSWEDHAECYGRYIADDLYRMAGVGPTDIGIAQLYDCFTYSVLVQFEDFGFCDKGEAGPFFAEGRARRDGELPVNTGGGLLSEAYIHGLNGVVEAVEQLRGDAGARQVEGVGHALVTAGGAGSTGSALILGQ